MVKYRRADKTHYLSNYNKFYQWIMQINDKRRVLTYVIKEILHAFNFYDCYFLSHVFIVWTSVTFQLTDVRVFDTLITKTENCDSICTRWLSSIALKLSLQF